MGWRWPDLVRRGAACPAVGHCGSRNGRDVQPRSSLRRRRPAPTRLGGSMTITLSNFLLAAFLAQQPTLVPTTPPRNELERLLLRSEERRVGKECGSSFRSRWSP